MLKHPRTPANPLKFKSALLLLALAATAGCVTVNVNFPESAVQKASDDYVHDLYRSKEASRAATPKASATPKDGAALMLRANFLAPTMLAMLLPSANAQEAPKFNMDSPKIDMIREKMKAMVSDVLEQKKAGVLGETSDGKLIIHDASALKPLFKKKVEDLVKEDNKTRESLYAEVVDSNHLPSGSLPAVRKSFSRSFENESPSGTWIQKEDGSWVQK